MNKFFRIFSFIAFLWLVQACSVNTETTYYKDSATSMQSNIVMDKAMLGMMNMMGNSPADAAKKTDFGKLTTDWKSLYDIQKDGLINLNQDSVKVLKRLFMKLNKENGEVLGLSVKYDKLLPNEIAQLFSQSKQLRNIPLQDAARWNGKTLTIDTEKFNMGDFMKDIDKIDDKSQPSSAPKTKSDSIAAYGKQMASGMIGMMKMFNMDVNSTMKFQKPIKSITGRHDFVKQLDKNTVQINVRTKDLMDSGKKFKNKDSKIIIETE